MFDGSAMLAGSCSRLTISGPVRSLALPARRARRGVPRRSRIADLRRRCEGAWKSWFTNERVIVSMVSAGSPGAAGRCAATRGAARSRRSCAAGPRPNGRLRPPSPGGGRGCSCRRRAGCSRAVAVLGAPCGPSRSAAIVSRRIGDMPVKFGGVPGPGQARDRRQSRRGRMRRRAGTKAARRRRPPRPACARS